MNETFMHSSNLHKGGGGEVVGNRVRLFKVNRNGGSGGGEGLEIFERKEWEGKMESLSRKRGT